MRSEPSWTSPPLKRIRSMGVHVLSGSTSLVPRVVAWYLKEVLDVLTAVEGRDVGGELQQILGTLSSLFNH